MERCKNIKTIHDGIINFIESNISYESNQAIDDTLKTISTTNNIEYIFRIPIENRIFNFNTAMEWLFFINITLSCIKEEAIEIPNTFDISFSLNDAMIYLSNIYDAKKEDLMDYFEESSDDEDD